MSSSKLTRRNFLATSTAGIGAGWLASQIPLILSAANLACTAESQRAPFVVLSEPEAALVDGLVSMIIPTDETPGAHEAGVVYFVDMALNSFAAPRLEIIRNGLAEVQSMIQDIRADTSFTELTESEQASIMGAIEETPFFAQFYYLTMAGMLSHPRHGGNRDKIGWRMIGFDDRHVWQHPLGHYDAQLAEKEG